MFLQVYANSHHYIYYYHPLSIFFILKNNSIKLINNQVTVESSVEDTEETEDSRMMIKFTKECSAIVETANQTNDKVQTPFNVSPTVTFFSFSYPASYSILTFHIS